MKKFKHLTNSEIAVELAHAIRRWRLSPAGANISQQDLSLKSGCGLTPIKRFEKTGGISLHNLIGLMRAMDLLDRLEQLIPEPDEPGPLDLLERSRKPARQRATRKTAKANE